MKLIVVLGVIMLILAGIYLMRSRCWGLYRYQNVELIVDKSDGTGDGSHLKICQSVFSD